MNGKRTVAPGEVVIVAEGMKVVATPGGAGAESAFRVVALAHLQESAHNPRKHFDGKALADLTASVKEKGILVPLLVRPASAGNFHAAGDPHFEIVAGARRYRAAKAAGLETVPVLVRALDDEQALEVQVIENLQRADVHPLEEAEGYKQLLARGKYDIAALAAKVGKSESYLYQRLKLAELAPAAKKAFEEERITAGHAILLARLQPEQQKEGLEYCMNRWNKPSVRDLGEWIQREIHLDLAKAPWKKDDAELLPAAGACTSCPKRTGTTPALFPEVKKGDTCTDPQCFHAKLDALVQVKLELDATAQLVSNQSAYSLNEKKALKKRYPAVLMEREYRKAGNTKCKSMKNALIIDGEGAGTFIRICPNSKCKTHRDPYASSYSRPASSKPSKAELARRAKAQLDEKVGQDAFVAAVGKVKMLKELPLAVWRLIAKSVSWGYYGDESIVAQALGVKSSRLGNAAMAKLKAPELNAFVFAHTIEAANGNLSDKESMEAIRLVGVDVAAIRAKLTAEAQAEAKAKSAAKAQTSPAAARGKAAKPGAAAKAKAKQEAA